MEALKILNSSLDNVTKSIVGYIYYPRYSKLYLALDESEAVEVTPHLALNHIFLSKEDTIFIPYPEKKSLYDMKKDPLAFHDWYLKNIFKYEKT